MNKLFSIVIPTYHRNDLLAECLNRLAPAAQTMPFEAYEVIVTDDGNKSTAEAMLQKSYPWAKWTEGPRRGPAANRNNGAKQAEGDWLVFLDDDCEPDRNLLAKYQTASIEHPNTRVFEGSIFCNTPIESPLYSSPVNLTGGYLLSCNFCVKKDLFRSQQGFDENFKFPHLEDNDFHFRLKQIGVPIVFVKDAKVNHPLRLITPPRRLSEYHESWFYYHDKIGENKTVFQLLSTIFRFRASNIVNRPYSMDSIIALKNLFIELWYTSYKYSVKKRLRAKPESVETI